MILLGFTCHRVKKCGKIPLGMTKCGNQFASHTFCGLPHLPKVSCGKLWLATKHPLNDLAPVPVTDGGERFCARGSPIHSTLFPLPYSTVAGHRAVIDSLDPISVFGAMVDTVPW